MTKNIPHGNISPEEIAIWKDLQSKSTPGKWQEFCESSDWWIESADDEGAPVGGSVCNSNLQSDWSNQGDIDFVLMMQNNWERVIARLEYLEKLSEQRLELIKQVESLNDDESKWTHSYDGDDNGEWINCRGRDELDDLVKNYRED